jgi:MSHA biogenesis protein MshQ
VTAYNGASTPAITPNFGKEISPEAVMLTPAASMPDLAGAIAGNLTCSTPSSTCANGANGTVVLGGFGATTPGVASNSFVYDEVGIMTLTPKLDDPDGHGYVEIGNGALNPTGWVSGNIGRFIPDHFAVTPDIVNPILTQADLQPQVVASATGTVAPATVIDVDDTTGFAVGGKVRIPGATASGNVFTATITALTPTTLTVDAAIGTDLNGGEPVIQEWGSYMGEPFYAQFSLSAKDAAESLTQNYQGAYAKLDPSVLGNPMGFAAVNGGINLSARLDTSTAASGTFGATGASVVAPLKITRGTTPDGPYAALQIGIAPTDSDGTLLGGASAYDLSVGGSTNHTSLMDAQVQATTEVRYGRTRISNAYGSELLALQVPMAIQYWNGSSFVTMTEDPLTIFPASSFVLSNYQGNLTNGASTVTAPVLDKGRGVLGLSRPGLGNSGSVSISTNAPTYLPSNIARATFGIYKSPLIYRRENY